MTTDESLLSKLVADLARLESKVDEVLTLRRDLAMLTDMIPNPIVRKVVKSKLGVR